MSSNPVFEIGFECSSPDDVRGSTSVELKDREPPTCETKSHDKDVTGKIYKLYYPLNAEEIIIHHKFVN